MSAYLSADSESLNPAPYHENSLRSPAMVAQCGGRFLAHGG